VTRHVRVVDELRRLIEVETADVNAVNQSLETALMHASYHGQEAAVDYLLSADAQVNQVDKVIITSFFSRGC
jgi:ankyrin repeat protein